MGAVKKFAALGWAVYNYAESNKFSWYWVRRKRDSGWPDSSRKGRDFLHER